MKVNSQTGISILVLEVLLSRADVEEILSKGSLEDGHVDLIVDAIEKAFPFPT